MLATFEREYSLATLKNEHLFESALDTFKIKCLEIAGLEEQGFFGESADEDIYLEAATEFMAKVKEFFTNLMKNIKEFITKVQVKIASEIESRQINKKLDAYYDNLANAVIKSSSQYMILEQTPEQLVASYKKHAKVVVQCTKELYSREYKNVEEYAEAYNKLLKVVEKSREACMLGWDETRAVEGKVDDKLKYTKKMMSSIDSINKAYWEIAEEEAKALQELAENEDDIAKIKDIQSLATKESNFIMKGISKAAKHPIKTATAVLGAIAATVGTVAAVKNKDKIAEVAKGAVDAVKGGKKD